VHPGDRVLEFGANIGRSSIVAAECAGPHGVVISTEADPDMRKLAEANTASLSNLAIVPAVSDTPLKLAGFGDGNLADSLGFSTSRNFASERTVSVLPMQMVSGGEWDVVIADCEGCFTQLVLNYTSVLHKTRAISIEYDDSDQENQKKAQAVLASLGFKPSSCVSQPKDVYRKLSQKAKALLPPAYTSSCFWAALERPIL